MIDFHGEPTRILENRSVHLEYLANSAHIVRFSLKGKSNLFADLGHSAIQTPFGSFYFRGGHRLWHKPYADAILLPLPLTISYSYPLRYYGYTHTLSQPHTHQRFQQNEPIQNTATLHLLRYLPRFLESSMIHQPFSMPELPPLHVRLLQNTHPRRKTNTDFLIFSPLPRPCVSPPRNPPATS